MVIYERRRLEPLHHDMTVMKFFCCGTYFKCVRLTSEESAFGSDKAIKSKYSDQLGRPVLIFKAVVSQ